MSTFDAAHGIRASSPRTPISRSNTTCPRRASARPASSSRLGVIARVRAVWGKTIASDKARPQIPAAISTAAVAVAIAAGPAVVAAVSAPI